MKKITAFLTALLLTASVLCGCNTTQNKQPNSTSSAPMPTVKAEQMNFIDFDGRYTESAFFNGDTLVMLMSKIFTDKEYEQNPDLTQTNSLVICDIKAKKLISDNEITQNNFDNIQMRLVDNKIALYDEEKQQALFYDFSGNYINRAEYIPDDIYKKKIESSKLITNSFSVFDDYSYLSADNFTAVVFDKKPQETYFFESEGRQKIIAGYDTLIAKVSEDGIGINDLAAKKQVCNLATEIDIKNIRTAAMNDGCLFYTVAKTKDDETLIGETPYILQYDKATATKSISVDALSKNDFEKSDENLIKTAKEKYDISIKFPTDMTQIPIDDYIIESKLEAVEKNLALRELNKCMSLYPTGFFNELKSKYNIIIDLYPVMKISTFGNDPIDGVTAEVTAVQDDCTVTSIAMTVSPELIKKTFSHEMTHALEPAFENYAIEQNDESMWSKLNPDGFDYDGTYDDYYNNADASTDKYVYQYDSNPNDAYFYDRYSKTFEREDRARVFENLFAALDSDSGADWLSSPHLTKKAELICDMMKGSFKAVSNSKSVYWEQNLNKAKEKLQKATKTD